MCLPRTPTSPRESDRSNSLLQEPWLLRVAKPSKTDQMFITLCLSSSLLWLLVIINTNHGHRAWIVKFWVFFFLRKGNCTCLGSLHLPWQPCLSPWLQDHEDQSHWNLSFLKPCSLMKPICEKDRKCHLSKLPLMHSFSHLLIHQMFSKLIELFRTQWAVFPALS